MKSTGIIRRIDDLGRIVIPREIRRSLRVRERDPLELGVEGDNIVLKKYSPSWFDYRDEFLYEDKTVFPIVAKGELIGFVAVSGKDHNEYVRAVVAMMAADIFEE